VAVNAVRSVFDVMRRVFISGGATQVDRPHAASVVALVVNICSFWNRAYKQLVASTVGRLALGAFKCKNPITRTADCTGPYPAITVVGSGKFFPEPRVNILWWSSLVHNKKPTPTSEVKSAVNRGNAYQGGQDMFSRFWRLLQSRASMVPIPA
jgi:hypothetical protein